MESYGFLRTLADSWGMLAMLVAFAGIVAWVFRPGSRKKQDDAANQIFRNEDKPKDDGDGH
ncbi:cbb3-type cytochrome c oxidase subunit 3 [Amaricoccus sp.]|uniref:cbb3-type cytochrome c oxidase subunit 3 n=1 Tax=Amaricoccus sp. TaxID=1872485 RepID=UPI001B5BD458|nr:cbb3-type cytochrome c oxidase subunit 3 [Amaricoccus sp.]MBP7000061.1 cbb3-type cytochrome c oxidase subunit 3 [Amaricoccus sp.]